MLNPLTYGLAPTGLGVYGRGFLTEGAWDFVLVLGNAVTYREHAAEAHRAGAQVWLWAGPTASAPDRWRQTVELLTRRAREVGAVGIVLDPENGWRDIGRDARAGEYAAMGAQLAALARDGLRVGVTSHAGLADAAQLVAACGDGVWWSPQIYSQGDGPGHDAAAFARWYDAFPAGSRRIPSIAGWVPEREPSLGTAAGYAEYLRALPKAAGAIVFPASRTLPAHMTAQLAAWHPGGSALGTVAMAASALLGRTAALAAVMVVVVAAVAVAALVRYA